MFDGKATTKTIASDDAEDKTPGQAAAGSENKPPRKYGLADADWVAVCREHAKRGPPPPPKPKPISIGCGGLFNTAEDVKNLLGLDTVPETLEAYSVPSMDKEPPVLMKYCLVPLCNVLGMFEVVRYDDPMTVMIDGQLRTLRMPAAVKDKRKLKKGKIPPLN